jgi:cell division septum initiation protein DivIVA
VAEITPAQVQQLLEGTRQFLDAGQATADARDRLGRVFLDTARQAKLGLKELSAVSGLHHATVRALIKRAIGPARADNWDQPELAVFTNPAQTRHTAPTVPSGPPPINL